MAARVPASRAGDEFEAGTADRACGALEQLGAERFKVGDQYPVTLARWLRMLRVTRLAAWPKSSMTSSTLPEMAAAMPYCLLMALGTVATETSARAATSRIVTRQLGSTSARTAV